MLRGRHRGLPDAIDRSVLLPEELARQVEMEEEFQQRQSIVREVLQNVNHSENAPIEPTREV